nr:uncharacterized protein LOC113823833 isoform X2 [Penaeus vannamei]
MWSSMRAREWNDVNGTRGIPAEGASGCVSVGASCTLSPTGCCPVPPPEPPAFTSLPPVAAHSPCPLRTRALRNLPDNRKPAFPRDGISPEIHAFPVSMKGSSEERLGGPEQCQQVGGQLVPRGLQRKHHLWRNFCQASRFGMVFCRENSRKDSNLFSHNARC